VRSNRVSFAVSLLYMALCAFATTSGMISVNALAGHYLETFPVFCAVAGAGLLIVERVALFLKARNCLQCDDREVRF
jgi:hypothetical protein